MRLIDSHCHLPHGMYKNSIDEIIKNAKAEGIEKMLNIGTDLKSSKTVLEICKKYEELFPVIGIYPNSERNRGVAEIVGELEELITPEVRAIGEIGYDITEWKNQRPVEKQKELFESQVELAQKHNLPIVIHNRNGDEETLASIKKYDITGVMHCFVSDLSFAKQMLDQGFYISFTAIVTYPSGKKLEEVVRYVPMEKILVETDAPYLAPQGFRKEVNEPKYVKITAQRIADIKGISLDEVAEATYKNTCELFKL